MQLVPAGPAAILIQFAEKPSQQLSQQLTFFAQAITEQLSPKVLVVTPSWNTLLIQFDLLMTDFNQLAGELDGLLTQLATQQTLAASPKTIELPVWYNGPDLAAVAKACQLSIDEVIRLHSEQAYFVGAIGFSPGFAYLATLPDALVMPRRSTPRTAVPAGSVAIAEQQTAVYPAQSPGGWHLLGRCPTELVNWHNSSPIIFQVGDRVRFTPISEQDYKALLS